MVCIALIIVSVLRPKTYSERFFKPIYRGGLLVLAAALAANLAGFLEARVVYAIAITLGVAVACLPVSGKLAGRW